MVWGKKVRIIIILCCVGLTIWQVALLMYNTAWRPVFFGNLLKLRCHFVTMEPELNRSV